ncbi:SLAC1 anion channel family protein [Lentibacillus saliphilus]|uniref:SLAC1 anion channel family protein n=1 Tax=Lentibacillus saliphilus TaxID=2737028 RepID=UPI001C2FABCD|nr:SLAC1 anion channel family protein [Lentibacillus saliphilus]
MGNSPRIRYFPMALWASVMGISGVTIVVRHMEKMLEMNHIVSTLLLIISTLLLLINGGALIYRLVQFTEDVKKDFVHPVKMNFFGGMSISFLLLAVVYDDVSHGISFAMWLVGAALQVFFTLDMLSKLIWRTSFQLPQANPAWFIPVVGNVVVPLAGVRHVGMHVNMLFFSVGILFSIILMAVLFMRLFFHEPLPGKLAPTMFIFMAPPAVGFVSYVQLVDRLDTFAQILFGIAVLMALLLLFNLKRFISHPFALSWWAFLFPSVAMTMATIHMAARSGIEFYGWLVWIEVPVLLLLMVYLLWKTIQLVLKKRLCVAEG